MVQALKRNSALVVGLVASSFLCVQAAPLLVSADGASGPTILQAESWLAALVGVTVCTALATVVAIVVGRIINTVVGLFVLGCGLFVLSLRLDSVRQLALSDGSLTLVAVETVLVAALVLGAVVAMFRFSGPLPDVEPEKTNRTPSLWGTDALICAAAGLLVLPIVWLMARSPMTGQAIGAVFVGAMVAGLVGRLLRPHVQPMLLFVSPVVFGAIGHLLAALTLEGALDQAYVSGTLSPLSVPMPIHYAAGSLMGVGVGLAWAKSFLHHEDEAGAQAAASRS